MAERDEKDAEKDIDQARRDEQHVKIGKDKTGKDEKHVERAKKSKKDMKKCKTTEVI